MKNRAFFRWLVISVVLVCTMAGAGVYAKYISSESVGGSLTIQANLGKIHVREHKLQRQENGIYTLNMAEETDGNSYHLVPGLDVPKDPWVDISGKSNMDAYVFIKVETNIPADSGVSYQLRDCWVAVAGAEGIYVYSDANKQPIAVNSDMNIEILKDNQLIVSQNLKMEGQTYLNFTAALSQVEAGMDAGLVTALFAAG